MLYSFKTKLKQAAGVATLLLSSLTAGQALAADTPSSINFGVIATDSQQNLSQRWEPILKDLGAALGVPVKVYFAPDYAGIIQAQRFGKVDFAYYGNKAAMEAVDRANAEIFARYISESGQQGYYSVLIANANNDALNSLDDVIKQHKDLKLGNGDPNSTSGYLVPNFYAFAQHGIAATDFKRSITANHGANVMAVANSQVDVATNNTMNLIRLKEKNPELHAKLKVIWKSVLIPSDVITWRKDLPTELKEKARNFFISYGKDGDSQALNNLHALAWSGLAASDNNQLLPIRQLKIYKMIVEIENNSQLSEEEKQSRTAKLKAQISDLQKKMDALQG